MLDRTKASILFYLINHYNPIVHNITKFKHDCPRSTLPDNYIYLLCKYKFCHLDFYIDAGTMFIILFYNLFVYKQLLNLPYDILNQLIIREIS